MAHTTTDTSLLLALPMELLVRITDFLADESLATLRLICRTTDAAVFDRFAKHYVEDLICCALFNDRVVRIYNILTEAPRLLKKVHWITFTVDVLEERGLCSLNVARNKDDDDHMSAQIMALSSLTLAEEQVRDAANLDTSLMMDVLELIAKQDIALAVDFAGLSSDDSAQITTHEDLFWALAQTDSLLDMLVLTPASCSGLEDILASQENAILKATSTITSLCYLPGALRSDELRSTRAYDSLLVEDVQAHQFARAILDRAVNLRYFHLDLATYAGEERQEIASPLLRSGHFQVLETLKISHTEISGSDLLAALQRCKPTLIDCRFTEVYLEAHEVSWGRIFQELASMPGLSNVFLDSLRAETTPSDLLFVYFVNDKESDTVSGDELSECEWIGTRESVVTGLQKLLQLGLRFEDEYM